MEAALPTPTHPRSLPCWGCRAKYKWPPGEPQGLDGVGRKQKNQYPPEGEYRMLPLRRVYPEWVGFYPRPKMPPKESKPLGTRPV